MRVLVGCEVYGKVRRQFRKLGHDAWSCDLLPTEDGSPYHIQGDLFWVLQNSAPKPKRLLDQKLYTFRAWDLLIFFWPCTNMAVSGAPHFKRKRAAQARDVAAFIALAEYDKIPRRAGENPVSVLSTKYRKPDQIIQPSQFGHAERKTTCLWLANLPLLVPTTDWDEEVKAAPKHLQNPKHYLAPGPERGKKRSETYLGVAEQMAEQWGAL